MITLERALKLVDTGAIVAAAFFLATLRADLAHVADAVADHETRIRHVERSSHGKPVPAPAG